MFSIIASLLFCSTVFEKKTNKKTQPSPIFKDITCKVVSSGCFQAEPLSGHMAWNHFPERKPTKISFLLSKAAALSYFSAALASFPRGSATNLRV